MQIPKKQALRLAADQVPRGHFQEPGTAKLLGCVRKPQSTQTLSALQAGSHTLIWPGRAPTGPCLGPLLFPSFPIPPQSFLGWQIEQAPFLCVTQGPLEARGNVEAPCSPLLPSFQAFSLRDLLSAALRPRNAHTLQVGILSLGITHTLHALTIPIPPNIPISKHCFPKKVAIFFFLTFCSLLHCQNPEQCLL